MAIAHAETWDAYCVNCGEGLAYVRDGKCTRCGKPAIRTTTQAGLDRTDREQQPIVIEHAPAAPKPLSLPDTAHTRRWLAATKTYAKALSTDAEAEQQAARAQSKKAHELADAAAALSDLVSRLDGAVVARPVRKVWSPTVDACIDCGKSDTRHVAHGRCRACDGKWRAHKASRA